MITYHSSFIAILGICESIILFILSLGGTNIAKVLTEHLGSLKTINGYLVVRQSTPLISLNFFKNLTSIVTRGHGFSPKE